MNDKLKCSFAILLLFFLLEYGYLFYNIVLRIGCAFIKLYDLLFTILNETSEYVRLFFEEIFTPTALASFCLGFGIIYSVFSPCILWLLDVFKASLKNHQIQSPYDLLPESIQRFLRPCQGRPFEWKDQMIVITGGADGLGNALARQFIRLAATVIILDVKTVDSIHMEACSPGRLFTFPCNVSDKEQVAETIQFITEQIGIPTILINNAGIQYSSFLLQLSDEQIINTVHVNLLSQFWLTRSILPHMIKNGIGHIINISSCLGLGGVAKLTDYCATKFGVYGFNESLRQELKLLQLDKSIHTTVVCPFLLKDSGMFKEKANIRFPFITPPIAVSDVVRSIVTAILYPEYNEEIWLPQFVYFVPIMRLFPTCIYDLIHRIFGSNESLLNQEEKDLIKNSKMVASLIAARKLQQTTTKAPPKTSYLH